MYVIKNPRKSKTTAIQRLDSKNEDKPPLPDAKLVQQWSLPQFHKIHTRFLESCPVRKTIMETKYATEQESVSSSKLHQDIQKKIHEHRCEEKQNDKLRLNHVCVLYTLDTNQDTALFRQATAYLKSNAVKISTTNTASDIVLSLVRNQHQLLCCIDKYEDQKCIAAATIEPYHEHHCVIRGKSVSANFIHMKDCSMMLVHNFYFDTMMSLVQMLHAINDTYTDLDFDYVMFDVTLYTMQHPTESSKLLLNKRGRDIIKVIPPDKEIQIDDMFYIGISKQQMAQIRASDTPYISREIMIHFWDFWCPIENVLRFMKVTQQKPIPTVTYRIPNFGVVHLTGEKGNIKSLVKKRFGIKETEFERAWNRAAIYDKRNDNRVHFIPLKVMCAGYKNNASGDSTCAWQAFCCIVRADRNEALSQYLMSGSAEKETYKDLRFTKTSKAAPGKKTLYDMIHDTGYNGILLLQAMSAEEKLAQVLTCNVAAIYVICLLQDDLGSERHAVSINFESQLVYDGYWSQPRLLSKSTFDLACGIGRQCKGIKILMKVEATKKKKRKRR